MSKGHVHAELMAQYVEDARETERPWERWERKSGAGWVSMSDHPLWLIDEQYRLKPRTITINGREVPEPMRRAPEVGQECYIVAMEKQPLFGEITWDNDSFDHRWLSRGLLHSTKEAAIAHTKALLSFTEQSAGG